jgi:hypothetical protein
MRYTSRTIIVSKSRISEAEGRVARQRKVVKKLQHDEHPADQATALLLVMEQSLLSMKRFLSTLERDLERSLGMAEKPLRRKAARYREIAKRDELAQGVVDTLKAGGWRHLALIPPD